MVAAKFLPLFKLPVEALVFIVCLEISPRCLDVLLFLNFDGFFLPSLPTEAYGAYNGLLELLRLYRESGRPPYAVGGRKSTYEWLKGP